MPIISGHAGDLLAVAYWIQDVQVTAVCLNRTFGALKGSLLCDLWCVPNALGMHLGQDTLDKSSTSMLVFPAL